MQVSDWSGSTYQDRKYMNKYVSQFGSGSQYSYIHDEDESSFQLVDNAKVRLLTVPFWSCSLGFDSELPLTLKLVFTASLLDFQH